MKFLARLVLPFAAFAPVLALAQQPGDFSKFSNFIVNIIQFINTTLVPLVFAIAFLVFLWGVFQFFILSRDEEEAKDKGRKYMLNGIIAFVVMVSVWGIVNLLAEGFGFTDENLLYIPDAPTDNN